MERVLLIGSALFVAIVCGARLALALAARHEAKDHLDWMDQLERVLNEPAPQPRASDETMVRVDDDRIRLHRAR